MCRLPRAESECAPFAQSRVRVWAFDPSPSTSMHRSLRADYEGERLVRWISGDSTAEGVVVGVRCLNQ